MKKQLLCLAAVSLFAFSAQANDIPYSFVEAGFSSATIDDEDGDVDGNGFKLAGSVAIAESFYAFGEFASYGLDFDVDLDYSGLGFGYRYEISPNTDITFDLAYRNLGIESDFFEDDESGHGIGIGIRSMISPQFELGGKIESVDIGGSETFIGANGTYYFGNGLGLGAEFTTSDVFSVFGVKLRYTF